MGLVYKDLKTTVININMHSSLKANRDIGYKRGYLNKTSK